MLFRSADLRLSERLARQIGAELHSDGDGVRLTLPCPATAFVETDG